MQIGILFLNGTGSAGGESTLPRSSAFDYIELKACLNIIAVALQYGSGTRGARITVSARGRV
jgi:hypothetical protein